MEPKLSESAADWLRYLENSDDPTLNWLAPHEDTLFSILRHGVNWEPEFRKAYELLTIVFPYFGLSLAHTERWSPLLRDALLMALDIHDNDLQIRVFRWMGEESLKVGNFEAARERFLKVLERAESDDTNINDLKVAVYIGLFKLQWFDLKEDQTQALVEKALDTAKFVQDRGLQADLYYALAPVYARKLDTKIGLGYGQTALSYWVSVKNDSGIGRTAYILASIYVYLNQLTDNKRFLKNAMAFQEVARDALARTDDVWQYPLLAYQEATIYFQLGDYESASSWFQQSLSEAENMNSPQYVVVAQHGFGLALSKLGQFALARRYLRFALKYWEELNNSYEKAGIFVGLADLEVSAGNKALAKSYVEEGLRYVEEIEEPNMRGFMHLQFQDVLDRFD